MRKDTRWAPGLIVRIEDESLNGSWMIRSASRETIRLACLDGRTVVNENCEKLEQLSERGSVTFLSEEYWKGDIVFRDYPEHIQYEVARRLKYVQGFLASDHRKKSRKKLEPIISRVSCEIEDQSPPKPSTLINWINSYEKQGMKAKGLIPLHAKKGNRLIKLHPIVVGIIKAVKEQFYNKNKMSAKTAWRKVEAKVLQHNLNLEEHNYLKIPAYSTVKYHLDKVRYVDKVRTRSGENIGRYEGADYEIAPVSTRILERVEADHTKLDIFVLDDDRKTLLGKPCLSALIDHYSKMIVGIQVSFEEPSYASVSLAIASSLLSKEKILRDHGVLGEWPAHGLMEELVTDNGPEFWGNDLEATLETIGTVLHYAPVRSPNYKGSIERFFRTVNTVFLDAQPGKTNGNKDSKSEYKAQFEADLTFSEFRTKFLDWIVNHYHLSPGEDGVSPLDKWKACLCDFPVPEEDEKFVETSLMCTDVRTLQRWGIQFEKLKYNSALLRDIYRRDGVSELRIKYSPFDLSHIYVEDDLNGMYIKVPCENYEYASGLTLYAHKRVLKRVRDKSRETLSNAVLQEAKIRLYADAESIHQRNARRKTQVVANKEARLAGVGISSNIESVNLEPTREVVVVGMNDEGFYEVEVWND
ncbi:Mu transposase C-terminal domain-containing protein [Gilvimarinus algae]|uniref:Mu transposase C-terminal domain-containing protein n=1 Tax=Gilvimarinus algae TaxID=3058037 RepID=A0ABT8T9U2_9GAMM|nr:Mu transposase C-terminal domain-containing protein [Gilvimarinus sp. SDUM040014]MDO3380896.1 Mu transposase C-terminal domain-containing protein [Gilvimarinus sp. SDUM040014]